MPDNRFRRICPYFGEDTNSGNKPCPTCAFYDVDDKVCRIIRTDENLKELILLLQKQRY